MAVCMKPAPPSPALHLLLQLGVLLRGWGHELPERCERQLKHREQARVPKADRRLHDDTVNAVSVMAYTA